MKLIQPVFFNECKHSTNKCYDSWLILTFTNVCLRVWASETPRYSQMAHKTVLGCLLSNRRGYYQQQSSQQAVRHTQALRWKCKVWWLSGQRWLNMVTVIISHVEMIGQPETVASSPGNVFEGVWSDVAQLYWMIISFRGALQQSLIPAEGFLWN